MPYKNKEDKRAYDARRKSWDLLDTRHGGIEDGNTRRRRVGEGSGNLRPFVGVDGEGGNDVRERHHYYLLRAGAHVIRKDRPLTWQECLSFIADLPPDNLYISYYFNYDVTMILRRIPIEKLVRLHHRERRRYRPKDGKKSQNYRPVELDGFEFDYLKGKEFKVRRKGQAWRVISDVSGFFQCSFVQALTKWQVGSPEQLQQIKQGKEGRDAFGIPTEEEIAYNALECDLLEQLMNKFRASCQAVGYIPRKWQGPGWLAVRMMEAHKVPKTRDHPICGNHELMEFAQRAYYGGRFETSAVGPIPGPVYNLDINSAYPFALTRMPCFVHGEWIKSVRPKKGVDYYLSEVSFSPNPIASPFFYGLPIRSAVGSISWPGAGRGTYWSMELKEARHQEITYHTTWNYKSRCDCDHFSYIPELYEARRKMGKESRGETLKFGLNSHAGKHMQSIGTAPYANPLAASFITSYTRAQLAQLIHSLPGCSKGLCGYDVFMLATDGVFTAELPSEIESSKDLGTWDIKTLPDGIFIVQPGFYYGSNKARPKTRGMNLNKALEYESNFHDAFAEMLQRGPNFGHVNIPIRRFVAIPLGLQMGIDRMGEWIPDSRDISFRWTTKRQARPEFPKGILRTLPLLGKVETETVGYTKDIGRVLNEWHETNDEVNSDFEEIIDPGGRFWGDEV